MFFGATIQPTIYPDQKNVIKRFNYQGNLNMNYLLDGTGKFLPILLHVKMTKAFFLSYYMLGRHS